MKLKNKQTMLKSIYYFPMLLLFLMNATSIVAQQKGTAHPLSKNSIRLGADLGLSFYNRDLARINELAFIAQEIENATRLRINPTINYEIVDRLLIGVHAGLDYLYAEDRQSSNSISERNFKVGSQLRYYFLKLFPGIYAQSEVGANYNFLNSSIPFEEFSAPHSYFKSYLNAGISFFPNERFEVGVVFKDLLTYHSSNINIDQRSGFSGSKVFKDFITFPHFTVSYKLN